VVRVHEYRDDDAGYLRWLDGSPGGYVLNIAASLNPADAKLHLSNCSTIRPQNTSSAPGPYVKICAPQLADLEQWVADHAMSLPPTCGACHRTPRTPAAAPPAATRRRARAPLPDGRGLVEGPSAGQHVVEAWAEDYIRYGAARPPWQQDLRADLRTRIPQLRPRTGQLLHATFVGDRPDDSDVENLLLYNIDAFKEAGASGIRFEQAAQAPPARDGARYPFHYRYELAPIAAGFNDWLVVRDLASFDWTDLGAFAGERKVAQVWLALKRGQAIVAERRLAAGTPLAVTVTIRPPMTEGEPRPDLRMKAVFDGVIAAFQAHTDTAVLSDVAARLATILPADPAEIARHLSDADRAVLGPAGQLVRPQRPAGTWNPGDHWCLAGELLPAQPRDGRWAIHGKIVEIARRPDS
jgi:hypothetical protein